MHFLHRLFQQRHINKIGTQKEKASVLLEWNKTPQFLVILLYMQTNMVYIADLSILKFFFVVLFLRFIQLKKWKMWLDEDRR